MKKFFLLIALFILIVTVSYFIPVTQSNDVIIKTNFDNVLASLKIPGNWEKWHPFIKKTLAPDRSKSKVLLDTSLRRYRFFNNTDSLIVEVKNPLLFDVQEYQKDKFSSYGFEIIPSFNATNEIKLRVIEKTPLLFYLLPVLKAGSGKMASGDLKNYLEDVKAFYGYDIKTEKVVDTVFATEMITIPKTDLFKILPAEFAKIRSFISEHALSQTNFTSVSYISKGDSIELILGIPVNKFVTTTSKINCVNIPKGRMLTATYEGKFCDRQNIYRAFKKYTKDNFLENVGAAFESYINDQLPSSDSSIVKFKLYYPIL